MSPMTSRFACIHTRAKIDVQSEFERGSASSSEDKGEMSLTRRSEDLKAKLCTRGVA